MSFWSNFTLNIYSMIILVIIYFRSINNLEKEFLNYKLFINMIKITFIMLAIDILSRVDGRTDTIYFIINHSANFMIFILNLILPSIWILYIHYQIFQDELKIKKIAYSLLILNLFNLVMVIFTQFYGWYYYIDSSNIYHRGDLYWITPAITLALMIGSCIFIFKNRKGISERFYFILIFFLIPPFLGIIVQVIFYGTSIVLNSVVLSILILFSTIQNRSIYIDYLTGLSNRKKAEMYLKTKVDLSSKKKTFSAIMIDLNDFKSINDIYGHGVGDDALRTSADLLKDCIRSKDFIARIGGDEFFIILDIDYRNRLEKIINRIKNSFLDFNKQGDKPYELSASMGYDVYEYDLGMGVEEFKIHLDHLMYEDKKRYKKN